MIANPIETSSVNGERLYKIDLSRGCQHHCITHAKNEAITEYLPINPEHSSFV